MRTKSAVLNAQKKLRGHSASVDRSDNSHDFLEKTLRTERTSIAVEMIDVFELEIRKSQFQTTCQKQN